MSTAAPTGDWDEFVRLAHRGVLHCDASAEKIRHYASDLERGVATPTSFLRELIAQSEQGAPAFGSGYSFAGDPRILPFRTPAVAALTHRLQTEQPVDRAAFDRVRQHLDATLGHGPPEEELRAYERLHRRRFWEAANAIAILLQGQPAPRVLDLGISVFLTFLKPLFPAIELVTCDRPVAPDLQRFFERVSAGAGAVRHVAADLGDPNFLTTELRAVLGTFDLILLTEVIEHVPVHPVHVLRQLLELLRPEGSLYLTTPNCFARSHLAAVARRVNPQAVFPMAGNAAGAHHYRELDMAELLQFASAAGGEPSAFYFSDCWDDEPIEPADQRSNLVVVLRRRS